ncbi:hypothetical protein ACHAXA_003695 [Cyclostephanos tholiformis]|uniref:Thioredoxin domain-containing protein n=1 Tax=Cyclostephanos tholiformis TaxID=382380 RepID=A0ABD3RZ81_9STRA
MRTSRIVRLMTLASSFVDLLSFEVRLHVAASVQQTETDRGDVVDDDDRASCSLDPTSAMGWGEDCSDVTAAASAVVEDAVSMMPSYLAHGRGVISLTDETFDSLTSTSFPSTWIIMFKTNACGICKKAMPVLESLSVDAEITSHNERWKQRDATTMGGEGAGSELDDGGGGIPPGPIYVATIDAGWSGRDTTKRFEVDATPTIILLRSDGYADGDESTGAVDARSYYVYRGQRAVYPMRTFVLGGYESRKRNAMPPPLTDAERKPGSYVGRLYEYYLSPGAKWAGGIIGKIFLLWFGFMGILGLFMRVHNYAWGDNDGVDDDEKWGMELEREKARGRRENDEPITDENTLKRQKLMWERKEENRAKLAAKLEARKAKKFVSDDDNNDNDDIMKGVGVSIKKSDAKKVSNDARKQKRT